MSGPRNPLGISLSGSVLPGPRVGNSSSYGSLPLVNPNNGSSLVEDLLALNMPTASPTVDPVTTAMTTTGLGQNFAPLVNNDFATGFNAVDHMPPGYGGGETKIGFWDSVTKNADGIGLLLDGLTSLGEIYSAVQQNNIARDSLAFQKDAYNTNLTNQTQSYNTALEDRAYARANLRGTEQAQADAAAYVAKHRLGG